VILEPWRVINSSAEKNSLLDGRKKAGSSVVLHLPWIERDKDQDTVFGKAKRFEAQADQEEFIRN